MVKVEPLFVLTSHWKTFPSDATENVVFVPSKMFLFTGCVEIAAAVPAVVTFTFVPV